MKLGTLFRNKGINIVVAYFKRYSDIFFQFKRKLRNWKYPTHSIARSK